MFFAATYPERVRSLVLVNAYARYARDEATPWGLSADLIPAYVSAIEEIWGTSTCTRLWHRAWSERRMHDNIGGASNTLRRVPTYWRRALVP